MASPSTMLLLLPALFLSLLLLMVPSRCTLDPFSTTLAISQATGVICGITAGSNQSIQCTRFPESAKSNGPDPIYPGVSFESISGGRNYICSLRSGARSLYCWDDIGQPIKRVYPGNKTLSQFSIGARHVAAIDGDRTEIRWWRTGCNLHPERCQDFPEFVPGEFYSLTSGDDFTCAINNQSSKVQCWGPGANPIQKKFSGANTSSIAAGASRMCGLNKKGDLFCPGDLSYEPYDMALKSPAIGSRQTCALTRKEGFAICWAQNHPYRPMGRTRFEFLVAGGDLTCGLITGDLTVACWGLNQTNSAAVIRSLPKILPGVCTPNNTTCSCGVYANSGDLCGGSGVICKKPETGTMKTCKFPPSEKWVDRLVIFILVVAFHLLLCLFLLFSKRISDSLGELLNDLMHPVTPL